MLARTLADIVVALHFGFVLFVIFGALAALRWPRVLWVHAPAALWGAAVELFGWICPLTPLENHLRRLGGAAGYAGGFVERHLIPVVYPVDLTRELQILLGLCVLAINVAAYAWLWRRGSRSSIQ
jgi:hypothetical protein